jgi:hypothetical protein
MALAACVVSAVALAGTVGAASAGPQLTGNFSATLQVVKPTKFRSYHSAVSWSFTAECNSGPCDVTISTLANSCVTGSCASPPSFLEFADAPLNYRAGSYSGTFTVENGCNADGTYYPYAYNQRTTLMLKPQASQQVGVGAVAMRQVTKFSGSLRIVGTPNATGQSLRCSPYDDTLGVLGAVQS